MQSFLNDFLLVLLQDVQFVDLFLVLSSSDRDSETYNKFMTMFSTESRVQVFVQFEDSEERSLPIRNLLEFAGMNASSPLPSDKGDAFCGSVIWCALYRYLCLQSVLHSPYLSEYKWFLFTRLEYQWLSPHLPLRYLESHDENNMLAWIPDGEDYGGLSDRHLVTRSQRVFELHMNHWEDVVTGRAKTIVDFFSQWISHWQVHEYLLAKLNYFQVQIDRFPLSAHLYCLPGKSKSISERVATSARNFSTWELCKSDFSDFWQNYGCVKYSEISNHPLREVKYIEEYEWSSKTRDCLSSFSFEWSTEAVQKCFCDKGHHREDSFYGNVFSAPELLNTRRLC